jgi:hypothetical protein
MTILWIAGGAPEELATPVLVCTRGIKRCDDARGRDASRSIAVWNRAHNGSDDGSALERSVAIRPGGDEPAYVIVGPRLAAYSALSLKAHFHGGTKAEGSVQCQRPAGAADRAAKNRRRGFLKFERPSAEFQLVEVCVDVRIVDQTAVGPFSDKRVSCHKVYWSSEVTWCEAQLLPPRQVSNQAVSHSLGCARRSNFEQIAWGLGLFEVVANPVAPECPVGDAGDKTFLLSAEGRDLLLQQALVFVVRPDPNPQKSVSNFHATARYPVFAIRIELRVANFLKRSDRGDRDRR